MTPRWLIFFCDATIYFLDIAAEGSLSGYAVSSGTNSYINRSFFEVLPWYVPQIDLNFVFVSDCKIFIKIIAHEGEIIHEKAYRSEVFEIELLLIIFINIFVAILGYGLVGNIPDILGIGLLGIVLLFFNLSDYQLYGCLLSIMFGHHPSEGSYSFIEDMGYRIEVFGTASALKGEINISFARTRSYSECNG